MELNAAVDRLNKEGFKPVDLCQVRRVQKSRLTNGKTWHGKGMFFFFFGPLGVSLGEDVCWVPFFFSPAFFSLFRSKSYFG